MLSELFSVSRGVFCAPHHTRSLYTLTAYLIFRHPPLSQCLPALSVQLALRMSSSCSYQHLLDQFNCQRARCRVYEEVPILLTAQVYTDHGFADMMENSNLHSQSPRQSEHNLLTHGFLLLT